MSLLWPSHKEFDVSSVQEVHNRCSDKVFFSWLNALVQGSDQVIEGCDKARPTWCLPLASRPVSVI